MVKMKPKSAIHNDLVSRVEKPTNINLLTNF